ncbi:DUF1156 domain-containing protein [Phormidium tenue]|uniref:DNA methylase n=1 Tax=Phormidium tenue NIES-30 TaxID=549789 RepID=A0A1U7J5I6_9CYAN|nr:DUF1156 domain-containing protein [Phormidium tenue]MBD2232522.1 DUF1156 domain-containing protein [Phormidium tenue FACHB-1052]OKH47999.1 DNA methylase [Phormidium tenue NIES-30]
MTDPKPTRPAVFIEKIFPVTLLNKQVYYEHGGNPFKGLHRWYSRKPLSFSRASVLGSLLPDTVTMEEFEYLLGLNRRVAGHPDSTTKLYKTPPSPERIKQVHDLCEQTWGTRTPTVLDAFAGGGSIPFEAVRYGLNVLASDLNPVAVVTMKAAMEYPLKFGPDLQYEIDKWVKWVGDEAEKRLGEFFPSQEGETVQNYLWAHTVVCPSCESVVPLSPNWWLDKSPNSEKKQRLCAARPIPRPKQKKVDFELFYGAKGSKDSIQNSLESFFPDDASTIRRGVGKCPNCKVIIEDEVIKSQAQTDGLGHQLYALAVKKSDQKISFRVASALDIEGVEKAFNYLQRNIEALESKNFIPRERGENKGFFACDADRVYKYGVREYSQYFNPRQLLALIFYSKIILEAGGMILEKHDFVLAQAILTYLSLVLDRCADMNSRLTHWSSRLRTNYETTSQHAFNLMWSYGEEGIPRLWNRCSSTVSAYSQLCDLLNVPSKDKLDIYGRENHSIKVNLSSADNLFEIASKSVDLVVTDPPYYSTIQYGELSDFFYVWMKRVLSPVFPNIFWAELTDKAQEAIANPSRFVGMGTSPEELANRDYEAKMALAFAEYYRVLRDDGVMTVQFNHKDSGAWDVLAKSLIDAGFEITASWAVSTENPQNLHQAQKNSVSSTVLLVCRKRDPNTGSAWWDEVRIELSNTVIARAPELEEALQSGKEQQAHEGVGIDLYLSAFGPALNVFSRAWPVLDSSGVEMRPEVAFWEARKAIANYRFRKLLEADTAGFDPLTQWYILAWDAFRAREFPFDEARQLALAVGGFNVRDLDKTYKLLDSASGTCKLLTPQQRLKKRAFSTNPDEFTAAALVDGLHAIIALYLEEQSIDPVRRFLKTTGLLSNDLFMRAWEVALKAIPHIGDERKRMVEEKALADLWLAMDEIQAKVLYTQPELPLEEGQMGLF